MTNVNPAANHGRMGLTAMQRSLWASQRLNPTSPLQNMAHLTHIDGSVDPDAVAEAFAAVVEFADVLNTRIIEHGGVPLVSLDAAAAETDVVSVSRSEAEAWATARAAVPIDMSVKGHDSAVLVHEDGTCSWYLALHHTVTDATGAAMVFDATSAAYEGTMPEFGQYYEWAERLADEPNRRRERAEKHWANREPAPQIDSLYRHETTPTPDCIRLDAALGADLLESASARFDAEYRMLSPELAWSTALCTAAAVHVHRVTGAPRLSIGLPVHGRSDPLSRTVVGPVVELFPVDVEIEQGDQFVTLHKRVGRAVLSTLAQATNGTAPSRSDFGVVVNVIPKAGFGPFAGQPTTTSWVHPGAAAPAHLMSVHLSPHTRGVANLEIDVNAAAIRTADAGRAVGHFSTILRTMFEKPESAITAFDLPSLEEHAALDHWRAGHPVNNDGSQVSLVGALRSALANRDDTAVEGPDGPVSGRELWDRVERTARWLRSRGVNRGDRVAIDMTRSTATIATIYAVLTVGASYVPLDPAHPIERRNRLAARAGCGLTISDPPSLDESASSIPSNALLATEYPDIEPSDEAYLLFTSGSTGEPKGVPITHEGLAGYLQFALEAYTDGTTAPVAPLFTALTFDLTVTTLFVPLLAGGRLVVVPEDGAAGLLRVAARSDLTFIKATPSHLDILVTARPRSVGTATVVVGGEAFPARLAESLWNAFPHAALHNEYGPTEAVVGCMIHTTTRNDVDQFSAIPIGRPAPGVTLAIVDDHLQPTPIGAIGELCIASKGLTAGYLDDHGGRDPFVDLDGCRYYRSGDLVRLVDDSTLMYSGRADEQIKVGGIRLEPTEVEHAIVEHPAIERAAVRLIQGSLTAWFTLDDAATVPSPLELTQHLAVRLPAHAIPTGFVEVDAFPVTANGKLDEAGLPAPMRSDRVGAAALTGPTTDVERAVIAVYEAALSGPVGLDDDFFGSGGDSLAAIAMIIALETRLGVPLAEPAAFAHTTARALAGAIEAGAAFRTEAAPSRRPAGSPPELSPGEASLLYEHLSLPESRRYNIARRYVVDGAIDADRLERALSELVECHGPLRWTYAEPRVELSVHEALAFDRSAETMSEAEFAVEVDEASGTLFDLEAGPLIRAVHRRLHGDKTGVAIMMHHVSGDAGTLDRLWDELDNRYQSHLVDELEYDYADHAAWQRSRDNGAAKEFWSCEQLTKTPATISHDVLDIADDGYVSRPASFGPHDLRRGPGTTPFVTALAALAWMLRQKSDGDDIAVAFTSSTRDHPGAEHLLGYYLNTLPLIVEVEPSDTGLRVAEQCRDLIGKAITHRTYPYAQIVADRRASELEPPSASVLFTLEELGPVALGGFTAQPTVIPNHEAVTDLAIFVVVGADDVELGVEYNGSIIDAEGATKLLDDLDVAILTMLDNPESTGAEIELPSIGQPVVGQAFTAADDAGLLARFAVSADARPETVAVKCGDVSKTYREIDDGSNQLAHRLIELGTGSGDFVGVEASRNPDTVIAILGVLKSGAAYVPLDPEYPANHRAMVLEDAGIRYVVSSVSGSSVVSENSTPIGLNDEPTIAAPKHRPPLMSRSGDPAYVIYTSGSTGTPKGVVVSHGNIAHSTAARRNVYSSDPTSFLLLSSFAFDSSMVGLWWSLTNGATIVLPSEGEQTDVWRLGELIASESVSHLLALPSLYELIVSELAPGSASSLNTVIVAGEACLPSTVRAHRRSGLTAELYNEFGPTEATVWTHAARVDHLGEGLMPPIGNPIPGLAAAVIDGSDRLVPTGTPGELVVAGPTLAAGYHGRDDLTATRFGPISSLGGDRWYRTGDLVRQRRDGSFMFAGRIDDQVKIRGHRVELGEVEAAATAHPAVTEAVAGVIEPAVGASRLAVWFTASEELTNHVLRDVIAERIPSHMVPSLMLCVDQLPRTPAGKVDRTALPDPSPVEDARRSGREPFGEAEVALAGVWAEVLGIEAVNADDNFFDLGGDSIVSIQIVSRLRKLGFASTPRDVFANQTIGALAATLTPLTIAPTPSLVPPTGVSPLTAIQSWFFSQNFDDPSHWNQSIWLDLEPDTDISRLGDALGAVVEMHPILKTSFHIQDGSVIQNIGSGREPQPIELHTGLSRAERERCREQLDCSLDHTTGLLVGAAAFAETSGEVTMYLTVHHLVIDGVSWGQLLDDVAGIYQQLRRGETPESSALSVPFRQWALSCAGLTEQETGGDHWKATGSASADPLVVADADNRVRDEQTAAATLDAMTTASWLQRGDAPHALIAATAVAFGEILDRPTVHLMLEGHGREAQLMSNIDITTTIGWFTSMYPIVVHTAQNDINAVVGDVSSTMASMPDSGVGYGIQRELLKTAGVAESPGPELAFNYLGQLDRAITVSSPFAKAGRLNGSVGESNLRGQSIGVLCFVKNERLTIEVLYVESAIAPKAAQGLVDRISEIVSVELTAEYSEATAAAPPQFDLVELAEPQLDHLTELLKNLDG